MGSVVLNGATSGATTLQPTDATTQTITLPANSGTVITTASSGKVIPTAALPAGTVLQVVQGTYNTSTSTTSTNWTTTSLTASITPTSSSSKVFVLLTGQAYASVNATAANLAIFRNNSTNLTYVGAAYGGSSTVGATATIGYLDSPATTSSTTYTIYVASNTGGNTVIFNSGNQATYITLMEIAA